MVDRDVAITILAKCYVAMAEVDYDLARWREAIVRHW